MPMYFEIVKLVAYALYVYTTKSMTTCPPIYYDINT